MPLIKKRRIWWEPVAGAREYVVYVSLEEKPINTATFGWDQTPGMISKQVAGKTELIIPDEWPEFPAQSGTYHIAVTARNEAGNESDPLLLSGMFNFIAPMTPTKGGIETLSRANAGPPIQLGPRTQSDLGVKPDQPNRSENHMRIEPRMQPAALNLPRTGTERENVALIQRDVKEVPDHQVPGEGYIGQKAYADGIHLRDSDSKG